MTTIHENYSRSETPDRQFGSFIWDRDDCCICNNVTAQLVARRSRVALDRRNSGSFLGGSIVPSGRIKAAQSALAQIRDAAAQGGKSHRDGFSFFGVTDGARHTNVREGPVAA